MKRAFTTVLDNAVECGRAPEVELRFQPRVVVMAVWDSGAGIAAAEFRGVSAPSCFLERLHSRTMGRVGLTSARSVIQGHRGSTMLHHWDGGGLWLQVRLPA